MAELLLKKNVIPAPNRLYVCAYMDVHFDYTSTKVPRQQVLRAFDTLVSQVLGEKGLLETVRSEKTAFGYRNVYDKRIHAECFDDCLQNRFAERLELELVKHRREKAKEQSVILRHFFDHRVEQENYEELFKDISDTKLSDAGDNMKERERVLNSRKNALWFVFKKEYELSKATSSSSWRRTSRM